MKAAFGSTLFLLLTSNSVFAAAVNGAALAKANLNVVGSCATATVNVGESCTTSMGFTFTLQNQSAAGQTWKDEFYGYVWGPASGKAMFFNTANGFCSNGSAIPAPADFFAGDLLGFREVFPDWNDQIFWTNYQYSDNGTAAAEAWNSTDGSIAEGIIDGGNVFYTKCTESTGPSQDVNNCVPVAESFLNTYYYGGKATIVSGSTSTSAGCQASENDPLVDVTFVDPETNTTVVKSVFMSYSTDKIWQVVQLWAD